MFNLDERHFKYVEKNNPYTTNISIKLFKPQSRKLSTRPNMENAEFVEYCKKINEISNRLNDEGMPMSYHEHMGTIIQTENDVDRFMDKTNKNTFLLYPFHVSSLFIKQYRF